jgi:pimeloyl-ACP methyl ester carboxylesterase
MRWHAIRRGDPLNAQDPLMMDAPPPPQAIEQAKLAFEAFQKKGVVPDEHIFLLGHSLGAYRAFVLYENHPRLAGVVMLAGASLIPSDLDGARDVIDKATKEWTDAKPSERSGDSLHEWSVHRLRQSYARWRKDTAGVRDRWGHRWPVDLAAENRTSTLLLVGSLDERWLTESYLFTVYLRDHQHPDYTWKVFEQLGHNLAREQAGAVTYKDQGEIASSRVGPIDPAVVKEITEWLKNRRR